MNSDSYFDLLLFIIYISNHITTMNFIHMYSNTNNNIFRFIWISNVHNMILIPSMNIDIYYNLSR